MSENQSQRLPSPPWSARPYHRKWLLAQADGLFDFFSFQSDGNVLKLDHTTLVDAFTKIPQSRIQAEFD